ncbi:MAG: hypothetical protein DDT24_00743 [Chloroflexi bacterium]|nr:hypothetical protein [Chloroflexota bacterium]
MKPIDEELVNCLFGLRLPASMDGIKFDQKSFKLFYDALFISRLLNPPQVLQFREVVLINDLLLFGFLSIDLFRVEPN